MAPKDGLGRGSKQRASTEATQGMHLEKLLSDSFTPTWASSLSLRRQNLPWDSVLPRKPVLSTPYLPSSLTHSVLGSPDGRTDKLLAEGVITSTPLLRTWARDTEHAPGSSLARLQGGEKKSFPESRLEMSQLRMSFILDPFQSISTQKGIKQRANCTQP